jgi:hypothetical protein
MHKRAFALAALTAVAACACTPTTTGGGGQNPVNVPASVKITPDGAGGFNFTYSSPFANANGDFDFTSDKFDGGVILRFSIDGASVNGIKFKPNGRDAMWIAEAEQAGQDGSPQSPYRGDQFTNFAVDSSQMNLQVVDRNTDRKVYRYSLRFDLAGGTVVDDPEIKNGGDGNN